MGEVQQEQQQHHFNWLQFLGKLFALVPAVVGGINNLHSEKDSATRRQMAHDSLLLASGVAEALDAKDSETIESVKGVVDHVIDLHISASPETKQEVAANAAVSSAIAK